MIVMISYLCYYNENYIQMSMKLNLLYTDLRALSKKLKVVFCVTNFFLKDLRQK